MSRQNPNCNAERALAICSLFESEVLVNLLLKHWGHPLEDDDQYRTNLLESATDLLRTAAAPGCSEIFIENMPANDMNLIAALWYVEQCTLQSPIASKVPGEHAKRQEWLLHVRRALPSCFCAVDDLGPS